MATPAWLGATTGSAPSASQVNQLLGTHASSIVYTGTERDNQSTTGVGAVNSNGLWIAQSFTAGATYATGRAVMTFAVTGTPNQWVISIQGNTGGAPSGTIVSASAVAFPDDFATGSATALSVPLTGASLVSGTTYWLVANAVGDVSNFFSWSKSNQVSGASTSTNGTAWTAQAYGLLFQVWDNTVVQPPVHTYEDSAARWTTFAWTAGNQPSKLSEYTVAQAANDYVASTRSFTYSGTSLTTIA
jgi:hypothetical protein